MKCQCLKPGYCETHQRNMCKVRHAECRDKLGYFEVFQQSMNAKKKTGLGDRIEAITKATGIKTVVDAVSKITGRSCGCQQRKEKLNEMFPG